MTIKKTLAVLLAVLFVVSMTAAAASAGRYHQQSTKFVSTGDGGSIGDLN